MPADLVDSYGIYYNADDGFIHVAYVQYSITDFPYPENFLKDDHNEYVSFNNKSDAIKYINKNFRSDKIAQEYRIPTTPPWDKMRR